MNQALNELLLKRQGLIDDPSAAEEMPAARKKAPAQGRIPTAPPAPSICQVIKDATPQSVRGVDRVRFLADHVNSLMEKDRNVLRLHMEHFVKHMLKIGASDLDTGGYACRGYIWYRVDGEKTRREEMGRYDLDVTDIFLLNLLSHTQMEQLMERYSIDFSFEIRVEGKKTRQRFRATIYFDSDNLALNMRAITDEVRALKTLGFHPTIEKGLLFRHVKDGLTLVTGVTGSGKSTTLDAIIDANNDDVAGHVVIIGKPIEFMHESKQCIVRHREVGRDVTSFKDGVVQALRQDPDIIVIGEMRDPDTISAALEVTDSGHKVFSTLHTSSAVESIDRIIGEYPPEEQERVRNRLADVLRCIVSQKLLPKVGGGRVLAKEVMWVTSSARAAIKNNNTDEVYQMMWEGGAQGQHTLEQDLFRLVSQRLITKNTAVDYANNKRRLAQLMGGVS